MALSQGEILAGKYRIEKLLGEGGMGAVYLATNQVLQKRVALKVMNSRFAAVPAAVERFLREAVAASRVSHPSIVQVFDAGEHGNAPWIAMELLEGESLGERLERGPMSLEDTLKMAAGVLSALAEVHEEGIIHRDLKPDNIFLTKARGGDWIPKVLDFGVAKDTSENQLSKLTATGAVVGTAYYLSPEQAKGLSDIDARTDVYAMGVVLFECLSGEMPYQAETITQLIAKMFSEQPRSLHVVAPHIPRPIADVVSTCIDLDRGRRFQTARGLLGALNAATEAAAKQNHPKAMGLAATAVAMQSVSNASLSAPGSLGGQSSPGQSHPGQSHPGQSYPGQSYPGQSYPGQGQNRQHHLMPSEPGFVAPTPSQPGVAQYASHSGVSQSGASHPGVQQYAPLPVSHAPTPMPQHREGPLLATTFLPGQEATSPVAMPESGGSRLGLIALVVLLFMLGAGGTGVGVWLFLGDGDEGGSELADNPSVAQHATTDLEVPEATANERPAPENAEPAQPQNAEPAQNTEPAQPEPVAQNAEPVAQNAEPVPQEQGRDRRGRNRRDRDRPAQEDPPAGVAPAVVQPQPQPHPVVAPPLPAQRNGLSQAQLLGAIQSQAGALNERCYQRRLARVPGLGGVITIAWNVRPDGGVEAARVVHNGTGDDWLARCTMQIVERTRFPTAANGQNTPGRYPFFFRPPPGR